MAAIATDPILASALWSPEPEDTAPEPRLAVNCKAIDAALKGGLDYGCITCISAETDARARDVTQALLGSHLLATSGATATVIDTGQAVDVRRLNQALVSDLSSAENPAGDAKAVLGRLRITKAFDFEGLTDGVHELRNVLEGRADTGMRTKAPRGTVPDSQDDEDEMLDEPTPPSKVTAPAVSAPSPERSTKNGLLIVDNITQLAAPLLKTNHASGQALITSFMRSLNHLTKAHNLCTLILNSIVSYKHSNEESPSVFASSSIRPALGKTWTYLLDTHLLVHQMPKTPKDAKGTYGGQKAGAETISVIEVLQDRYDGRIGRWAAFSVEEGGKLKDAA